MLFQSRSFWHPKDIEFANVYEDSFRVDPDQGIIAIADGVSSAMFSKGWADILTQGVIENPPVVDDRASFAPWLANLRSVWTKTTDLSKLNYFQRQKLDRVGGGYSTLLWIVLKRADENADEQAETAYSLQATALGDCCVFVVRDGQVITKFAMKDVQEFEEDPLSIGSCNSNHDDALEFRFLDTSCQGGDLVVLATDAISKWVYQQLEADEPVDWECLWNMTPNDWASRVAMLRDLPSDTRMRVDDTTMVMLRMASRETLSATGNDDPEASKPLIVSPYPEAAAEPEASEAADAAEESFELTPTDFQPADEENEEDFVIELSDDVPASASQNGETDDLHEDLLRGDHPPH